ncbi:Hypothetical protein NTJ_06969 [Nesidiocoris tenuis]|uniref:Uncharacterized protein n=1 Tax=Nesidiocoris tenuis TaxID=355587 RepID=A0ABN7APL1_9HEMI|nr:Hypothetical protein NTJ_06969 [Nesidiocoris tenuis]
MLTNNETFNIGLECCCLLATGKTVCSAGQKSLPVGKNGPNAICDDELAFTNGRSRAGTKRGAMTRARPRGPTKELTSDLLPGDKCNQMRFVRLLSYLRKSKVS